MMAFGKVRLLQPARLFAESKAIVLAATAGAM
jgi:hypothetical protein